MINMVYSRTYRHVPEFMINMIHGRVSVDIVLLTIAIVGCQTQQPKEVHILHAIYHRFQPQTRQRASTPRVDEAAVAELERAVGRDE